MWNHVPSRLQEGSQHIIAHTCVRFFTNMNALPNASSEFSATTCKKKMDNELRKTSSFESHFKVIFRKFQTFDFRSSKNFEM
jgi:hypothetical protein